MLTLPVGLGLEVEFPFVPQTPGISRITPIYDNNAGYTTYTSALHTSLTGNVVLMFWSWVALSSAPPHFSSVTWAGDALTEALDFNFNDGGTYGQIAGWAGYKIGGVVGAGNIVVTPGANGYRKFFGWAIDLDRALLPTSTLASTPQKAATHVDQGAQSVSLTRGDANGLILGSVAAVNGNLQPFSVNAGWTLQKQGKTATSGTPTSEISGLLASRTSGGTGAVTLTGTTGSGLTNNNWGAMALEFAPA